MPKQSIIKILVTIARYGLVSAILWWLFATGKIDLSLLQSRIIIPKRFIAPWYLCLVLIPSSLFLLAYRWQKMLQLQKIRISFLSSLSATFQANFFSILLPGMAGGDLVKIAYITRSLSDHRMRAVLATFYDRLLGVFSLLLVTSLLSAIFFGLEKGQIPFQRPQEWENLMFLAFLAFITCCALLVFLAVAIRTGMLERFHSKEGVRLSFTDIPGTWHAIISCKKQFAWLVCVSCVNHVINILVFVAVGMTLEIPLGVVAQMMVSSMCMLVNILPITPGGIGVTESAFYYLFQLAGSDAGGTLGLIGRLLNYLIFLTLGLPFFLLRGGRLETSTE